MVIRSRRMKKTGYTVVYKLPMALGFAFSFLHLLSVAATAMDIYDEALETVEKGSHATPIYFKANKASWSNAGAARKLLALTDEDGGGSSSVKRIGGDIGECTINNIQVFQGASTPLPNGIPTYTVQVENVCISESCSISNIHISCGWFSSARNINPSIFRRVSFDDCLLNDGEPMNPAQTITFQYANTFPYPLSVSSVNC